jgi:hypothetical protein
VNPGTIEDRAVRARLKDAGIDPRSICLAIAETVEHEWSALDQHLYQWPRDGKGDPYEFQLAELAKEIGEALILTIDRLNFLKEFDIGYVYRNKDGWVKAGKLVLGQLSKANGLVAFYSGHDFEMKLNWMMWEKASPWQKVALVYHELRHGDVNKDDNAAIQGHDIECFFDELSIFGTQTYEDWARLAKSAAIGSAVKTQYHMEFDA